MGRVYATEEGTGKQHLVRLECDRCGATIKPGPDIMYSGWMKFGVFEPLRAVQEVPDILCPDCAYLREYS